MPPHASPPSKSLFPALLGAFLLALVSVVAWLALRDDSPNDRSAETSDTDPGTKTSTPPSSIDPDPAGGESSARASGRVRSTGEAPLQGARVTLLRLDGDEPEPIDVACEADGSWSIAAIEPGRYGVSATADNHLPAWRPPVRFEPGADLSGLDLTLEPGGSPLAGTVRDLTGGEIEGARIWVTPVGGVSRLREPESFFAITDADGRYTVRVAKGRFRVRASHPDYTQEQAVLDLGDGARTQDFQLVPMGVIEGVVLREAGRTPVEGATVTWNREVTRQLPGGGRATTLARGGSVKTDADGRFRARGLLPGTVLFNARAPGLASASPTAVPIAVAERVDGIEILVGVAADLMGRVVASDDPDHGIAGAEIQLDSRTGPGGRATTDSSGHFVVHGVIPGGYALFASADGWLPAIPPTRVEVDLGQADPVVVTLTRGLGIRGRVEPAASAEVRPETMEFGGGGMGVMMMSSAAAATTDPETGDFELAPVQPGTYTLVARAADGRGGRVEVEVGERGADDVVIRLEPRAKLAGVVRDAKGTPIPGASVTAHRVRADQADVRMVVDGRELTALQAPTSDAGRYELLGLDAGAWSLEVTDAQGDVLAWADGSREPLTVELGQAEVREGFDLAVETRDGVITGVVRDADGEPVADAWVSAAFVAKLPEPEAPTEGEGGRSEMRMVMATDTGIGAGSSLPPTLTDADGKFRFAGLRRGPYLLTAESTGAGGGVAKGALEDVVPDATVIVKLAPLGTLEGKVTGDPDEDCIARDCIVRVSGPTDRSGKVHQGTFEIDRLEPGHYSVEIETIHGGASAEVDVEAGGTANVELPIQRFARVTGRVVDAEGQAVAGAEIMVGTSSEEGRVEISREGDEEPIVTDGEGRFDVPVAPGARVIIAIDMRKPGPVGMERFTVESGKDLDLGDLDPMPEDGARAGGGPGKVEE